MTDRRRLEEFRISGMKTAMTNVASSSHSVPRSNDGLQQHISRDDAPVKPTEYTFLQLINMVRDSPILYDESLQATIPDSQLKIQKRDIWDRIRTDIVWQDTSRIQDAWVDILDQYSRKSPELSETLMEALRWTNPLINKKKLGSRPPSQLNPMTSGLEKDFYNEVPLADEVLEPEQDIGDPKFDYVVIQPSVGVIRPSSNQSMPSNTTQFSRKRSPSPRTTDAIVRSYPLSPKRTNQQMQLARSTITGGKKDTSIGYGGAGVMVEVESSSSYPNSNSKMYKMVRNANPQNNPTNLKRVMQIVPHHRAASIGFDSMPEQIIETPSATPEPPAKKKMEVPTLYQPPMRSKTSKHHSDDSRQNSNILSNHGSLVDDDLDLGPEECKMEVKIGQSLGLLMDPGMPSTSEQHMSPGDDDPMHHYHHDEIEDNEVVVEEEIEHQSIESNGHDLTIQYDEDLAFQQHINSVLNRLPDDDKAVMKFNMQKIILDARFGSGTARSMLYSQKDDDILVVEGHVESDTDPVENSDRL